MRKLTWTCLAVVATALVTGPARADAPREIPFQAAVRTAAGDPLPDTPVSVTFKVYAASGGPALWTDTKTLTPSHGILSARIAAPASARFDQPYTVGVQIAGDPEMTPRLPLSAAPYALALPNVTVDSAKGAVGIGIPPDPGALFTVAGAIHSTVGGFVFPDGTVQTTAQVAGPKGDAGPPGPAGPQGPSGGQPSYPSDSGLIHPALSVRLDSGAFTPVALAKPFTMTWSVSTAGPSGAVFKIPNQTTYSPLVLTRAADPGDKSWSTWARPTPPTYQDGVHDVTLQLSDSLRGTIATWTFPQCKASTCRLVATATGMPTEEVTLLPASVSRTMVLPFRVQMPPVGAGEVNLFLTTNDLPGSALIVDQAGTAAPTDNSLGGPAQTISGPAEPLDSTVRIALDRLPDYFAWFQTGGMSAPGPDATYKQSGTITVARTGEPSSITENFTGAFPDQYALVPTQDGGLIEEFQISLDTLTRE